MASAIAPVGLLCIDPGADLGWAVFVRGALTACGLYRKTLPPTDGITHVVCERPRLYGKNQKASSKSIITLALRAGEACGPYTFAGAQVTYHEPPEWKGSIDKNIHHARIWPKLSAKEQDVVSRAVVGIAQGKHHNILDGIAIGLFELGRVGVGGL